MNNWQPSEWDRGYEAGRKAGIAEATARIEATSYDFSYKKYVQAGADNEQQRIIKLLEESHRIGIYIPQGVVHTCDKATDPNSVCSCWQIALIQKKANN